MTTHEQLDATGLFPYLVVGIVFTHPTNPLVLLQVLLHLTILRSVLSPPIMHFPSLNSLTCIVFSLWDSFSPVFIYFCAL